MRGHLLDAGFRKNYDKKLDRPELYDRNRDGAYTEDWIHPDGTAITLKWATKDKHIARCHSPFNGDYHVPNGRGNDRSN